MNDTICTYDIEKANLLNTHFKTRSDLNDTGKELPHITQSNPNNLSQLQTKPMEIRSILETLPTGKASGPDNIKNYVLKSCSSMLSYSLSRGWTGGYPIPSSLPLSPQFPPPSPPLPSPFSPTSLPLSDFSLPLIKFCSYSRTKAYICK